MGIVVFRTLLEATDLCFYLCFIWARVCVSNSLAQEFPLPSDQCSSYAWTTLRNKLFTL